ncbi:hypothetical protein BGW37DRAFT_513344 [Umbelopsis sp. PMI_123]|nr:hypothetical protein BGW37DRAFT_513344 [Umbelopsis sp. PMI_123]
MLIRYGYLPRIRTLFEVPSLISTIQNIHIQSKRKNEQVLEQPIKKQYKKQIKTIDIHSTDDLNDVEYYFEKGLRKVRPYYYKYQAFAKGRWMGRSILDVFSTEFRDQTKVYYEYAIGKGLITINGEKCTVETIIKSQDVIGHQIHRHEPAVTDQEIKIIARTDGYLVIDKPGSIPVHPSGRYRHNTVIHILQKEHHIPKLYPINRLDRLTSGLMLIATSPQKAQEFERQMSTRTIKKEYVCKVTGEFPEGRIVCNEPIKTVSFKLGLNCVHEDGKDSRTVFERQSYNGKTSIVRCYPFTGRTHQIRVHLQYLGYPIANDPLYTDPLVWGESLGKGKRNADDLNDVVDKMTKASPYEDGEWNHPGNENDEKSKSMITCPVCSVRSLPDFTQDELCIWLHAIKYSTEDWSYETDYPSWAKDNL